MITLSIYTHLFGDAFDPVMDRLDAAHRYLVRPKSGPNVVELPEQRPSQASDQGGLDNRRGGRAVEGDGLENR